MKDSSPAEPRYVGGTTPEHVLFVVALSGVLRSASGTSYGAALDPAGTYAFISRANGQQILAFAIDQQTFAMTAGPTTTVAFYPAGVIVNPKAPFLYAAGLVPGATLGAFAIADGGALSPIATDGGAPGVPGFPMAFDPSGEHLYVGGTAPLFSEVRVNADGTLAATGVVSTETSTASPGPSFVWVRF
jgi:hypothetical protein